MILMAALCCIGGASAQKTTETISFNKDQHLLTPEAKIKLESLSEKLRAEQREYKIEMDGHTDSDGSNAYNEVLSLNRVDRVRNFLQEHGIPPDVISSAHFGEEKPRVENKDEAHMAINRRVEIRITYKELPVEEEIPKVVMDDRNRDTVLILPKGTRVEIHLHDFDKYRDCILENTKEITTSEEMLEEELSLSTSDEKRLVTSGMIRFADCGAKFEHRVRITMPVIDGFFRCNDSSLINEMRLYMANHDGNWVQSDSALKPVITKEEASMVFDVWQGGTFNCDALPVVPLAVVGNVLAGAISFISAQVIKHRMTIKFSAPDGKVIRKVELGVDCCGGPNLYRASDVRYNKARTKARIDTRKSCCMSDSAHVSFRLKGEDEMQVVPLCDLKFKGRKKYKQCYEQLGPLASVRRFLKKPQNEITNRKYYLVEE